MKKLLLALVLVFASTSAWTQNTTCTDRPIGDSSNACANTRFVLSNNSPTVNYCPLADRTGVLDSTVAIQACLTASNNVYLRFGNYKISAQLVGHDNLTFGGDPGVVIQQLTRGARGIYLNNLSGIEINDLTLYGEGTYCGNVGQAVTAACPTGQWVGDGGIDGINSRGIQLNNCTNCRFNRLHLQNWGNSGISIFSGNYIYIDQILIEGTNLYTTPITAEGNYQYGINLSDGDGFGITGAINNLFIDGASITGTAQGFSFGQGNNPASSVVGLTRQITGSKVYNITGQHAFYGATSAIGISGFSCARITDACIKNQNGLAGEVAYNFSAIGIVADTVGGNMFEIGVIGGVSMSNVHVQGIGNAVGRGLSIGGTILNLVGDIQIQDTLTEGVFIQGDGAKDIDISLQSNRSGGDCIEVVGTNADRIRFHHPICRNPSTTTANRYGLIVASASANVTVEDGVFVDSGARMLNGIANTIAGGTIKLFDSIAITGATSTCITATGVVSTLPIWTTLSCTGGNYTGPSNISRGALGDVSVPFTSFFLSGTSGGIPYFSTATTVTSSAALAANQLVLGGGAGAAPATLGSLGTTTTVLHGNAAGAGSFGAVANADLVNASTTVNGQTCTLGAACTVTASAGTVTVGTTTVASGTTTRVLFDNAGVLGEYPITGTTNVVMSGTPTIATPVINGLPTGTGVATANTASTLVARDGSGNFAVGVITGALSGNATTSTTSTNSGNSTITDDNATNATMNLAWVTSNTGNLPIKVSSSKLVFNPGTGIFSAPTFNGAGTNLTGTGASFTAGNVTTNANLTGAVTSVGNATSLGSFTSASLLAALTDETGSGSAVFGTSPILSTVDARGTWTTGTSWTVPAHTLNGTISGGGNQINNVIIGTTTPLAGTFTTLGSGAHTITSASATALTVGLNGATNPAFQVDSSTGSQASGLKVTGGTSGGGVNIGIVSSATNEDMAFNAKAAGVVFFASASTGGVDIGLGGGLMNVRSPATFTSATIKMTAIASDAASTDSTMCLKSSDGTVLKGSGTLGICLGTSSAKFKHDIAPMGASLAEIVRLAPKNFFYNKGYGDDGKRQQYGFIAEDVVKVLPGVTSPDATGKPQSVDLLAMVPILVNAIKQLKADNDNLRMDVLALQANRKANAR